MQNRKTVEKALANFADPLKRDRYFELYSPDIVLHGYEGVGPGIEAVKQYYHSFWLAFPDARVVPDDIIEADDKVVVRFTLTGTHRGIFLGIDGTQKPVQVSGMTILRFEKEHCVERWSVTNSLSLAAQLGLFPPPK